MNTDKARERMLKLLALARRGEGGERDNAQRFLDRMLQKHGLTLADLDDQEQPTEWQRFAYGKDMERRLLEQVLSMVLKVNEFSYRQDKKAIHVKVTKAQHIEIELHFRAYQRELKSVLEHAFIAFVQRNDIFSGVASDDAQRKKYSADDLAQIMALMSAMPRTEVRRQLGFAGEHA
ncbi:hypothetical protein ACOTFH_29625 [Achromobacter xylosoxidans]